MSKYNHFVKDLDTAFKAARQEYAEAWGKFQEAKEACGKGDAMSRQRAELRYQQAELDFKEAEDRIWTEFNRKKDLSRLEDTIKILNSANENNLEGKVTSIDISDKNEYSIYIESEKKRVHLGDSTNLSNKMLYILAIIEKEKDKEGDIFVNGDLNNKFQPYFREKV